MFTLLDYRNDQLEAEVIHSDLAFGFPPLMLPSGEAAQSQVFPLKIPLSSETIVFGHKSDPFWPFESRFHSSRWALETICRETACGKLLIQTRSPLIVLALPVLTLIKSSLTVRIALECISDESSKLLFPDLPSYSERLKTARTLRAFGFTVEAQLAPVSLEPINRSRSIEVAGEIAEAFDRIGIAHPKYIRSRSSKALSRVLFAREPWGPALAKLRDQLRSVAAEKLLSLDFAEKTAA